MMLRYLFPTQSPSLLFALVTLLLLSACGGGGGSGGPAPEENVTVTGTLDDGSGNTPIPDAVCRFLLPAGAEVHSDFTDAAGAFQLVVTPDTRGHIVCSPRSAPSLSLSTFSSTHGYLPGDHIDSENVTPATTVVADIVRYEDPADPEARKIELLSDIVSGRNANLDIVVAMAERLYKAMLTQQINASFTDNDRGGGGDGGGASDGDSGGASGDAGDGADFSPLKQATCEFVVGDTLGSGDLVTSAALADFIADGLLDRPDLAAVAAEVNQGVNPAAVKSAFAQFFPEGLGRPIATLTDDGGQYTLPIPPGMAGFIRCFPADREQLLLGSFFPGRGVDQMVAGQKVNPATTVFSTDIAPMLPGDLATVLENFKTDIVGLEVLLSGPNLPEGPLNSISLGTDTLPANSEAGLVAFAVTALFNAFNKNGLDVDFPAAITQLRDTGGVTPAFLVAQGVPADQSQGLADLINTAITTAAGTLGTDLMTAWSTGRINVTLMDDVDGSLISDATIDITNTDFPCTGCGMQTDSQGQLTLAIGRLGPKPTDIEVEVSGVPGFESTTVTTPLVGFATIDLEIRLTNPARDAQAPAVTITSPPSGDTYSTDTSSLNIGGTASDDVGVVSVSWSNDRNGSGVCEGTDNWSASGIALSIGTNQITVTARDAAGNEGSATLTVTYSPSDSSPPSVTITSPTSNTTYRTNDSSLNLGGSASDDEGVIQVRWSNDSGDNGICNGTNPWSASGIPLQAGDNVITVTAEDGAGNTATATLTVTYEPLYQLTIQGSGSGSGFIFDNANLGIDCTITAGDTSGTCTGSFPGNTDVSLGFEPLGSAVLTAWSGPCSGAGSCNFTLTRNQTVTATIMRSCTDNEISIDPASAAFPEAGGQGSFDVNAPEDCVWTAFENESWITLTDSSGLGPGTVRYQVAANTGTTTRTGTIAVNQVSHRVSQTWSDFIADWNAADPQEGEIYRVLIVDNGNSGVTVNTSYWCDGGPYCDLPPQSFDDPGAGPISFTYNIGAGYSQRVTLTLQSPTSLHALRVLRIVLSSGTVEYPYNSDLVPD